MRVDRVVTRVLGALVAYLRLSGGTDGEGAYGGEEPGNRVMVSPVGCLHEHNVGKGTTERTEGSGRDTTF
jgi:hypothetical protein